MGQARVVTHTSAVTFTPCPRRVSLEPALDPAVEHLLCGALVLTRIRCVRRSDPFEDRSDAHPAGGTH